ncbi:hypothetical protein HZA98_05190 [Candidatus Woesearchaeota archaeon]|nr:hypothetical protein [Candidatus Woesearchaeota archaeon]
MLTFDEKTAEIVGLSFGDGSLTRRVSGKDKGRLRFQLRGDINEDREHYDSYVKPLFDKNIGRVNFVTCNGNTASYGIYSERKEICSQLLELGIPLGVKKELIIPEWIKDNSSYSKAFLRGYFDTDGGVFCGRDYNYPEKKHIKIRIAVGSICLEFINEVHFCLNKLGVHSLVLCDYKPKLETHNLFRRIQISGQGVLKYIQIVGTKNPKHLTKYEIWK